MTDQPPDFVRGFGAAFAARDAAALAALCSAEAEMLTLTGLWCADRAAIEAACRAEFAGALSRARLVTGKGGLRMLTPGCAALSQRFVLSGVVDAEGRDTGRVAAMLTGVLVAGPQGWQAAMLGFNPVAG